MKANVLLTDATTGRQIWGDAYSIDLEAALLIDTQEEIACTVIAAIAGEYGIIARRLSRESRPKRPADLNTYEALLHYHHYMLVLTPEAGEAAFSALRLAAEREPEYAPAWAGLATLHCHALIFGRSGIDEPLETASRYARRAAALDPRSQMARTILAYVHMLRGEMTQFWSEAEAALDLNPNSPNHVGTIGYLMVCAGHFERGRQLLDRSIALNPCHPKWFHHALYLAHFSRGEYDEAYREALQVGFTVGLWDPALRAAALAKLGREDEARAAAGEIREHNPDFEIRVREILSHNFKPANVREDLLDGLRLAGLRID
jgi:adenylate cyclase